MYPEKCTAMNELLAKMGEVEVEESEPVSPKTFLDQCEPIGEHDWQYNPGPEGGIKCSRCSAVFTAADAHHAETGE